MGTKTKRLYIPVLLAALTGISAVMGGCAYITGEAVQIPAQIQPQVIEDITPHEAYALIQENEGNTKFVIIDVRTPEEYASGHIEKAINLNYRSDAFRDELIKLDKCKTYLIYCRSGRRSAGALDMMAELGFREVYNMLGGIVEWEQEGFTVVQ